MPSDAREKIQIVLPGATEILESKILFENSDASEFGLTNEITRKGKDKAITLSWKHFDSNDGVELQMIYTSEKIIEPIVKGKINGLVNNGNPIKAINFGVKDISQIFQFFIMGVIFIAYFLNNIKSFINDRIKKLTKIDGDYATVLGFFAMLCFLALIFAVNRYNDLFVPPF